MNISKILDLDVVLDRMMDAEIYSRGFGEMSLASVHDDAYWILGKPAFTREQFWLSAIRVCYCVLIRPDTILLGTLVPISEDRATLVSS